MVVEVACAHKIINKNRLTNRFVAIENASNCPMNCLKCTQGNAIKNYDLPSNRSSAVKQYCGCETQTTRYKS